jgi:hypothetical protein
MVLWEKCMVLSEISAICVTQTTVFRPIRYSLWTKLLLQSSSRSVLPSQFAPFSLLTNLQVQGVLADQKSLDLRTLLENARGTDNPSNRDIIRYRREAELNVGSDEHLYKVDWVSYSKPFANCFHFGPVSHSLACIEPAIENLTDSATWYRGC